MTKVILDLINSLPRTIEAMHGLVPGVQYASLITFAVVMVTGILAIVYCYTHPRN